MFLCRAYNDKNEWSRSFYNENKTQSLEQDSGTTKDRLQRLGYTTGYGTINVSASTKSLQILSLKRIT